MIPCYHGFMAMPLRVHHHSPAEVTERPFRAPVQVGAHQNSLAHGDVEQTQTCSCGETRRVLVNGRHREIGGWG